MASITNQLFIQGIYSQYFVRKNMTLDTFEEKLTLLQIKLFLKEFITIRDYHSRRYYFGKIRKKRIFKSEFYSKIN